ncbi:hypothetical protein ACXGQW_11270 [Wenyingzhuangia sp. IMCC45533]
MKKTNLTNKSFNSLKKELFQKVLNNQQLEKIIGGPDDRGTRPSPSYPHT